MVINIFMLIEKMGTSHLFEKICSTKEMSERLYNLLAKFMNRQNIEKILYLFEKRHSDKYILDKIDELPSFFRKKKSKTDRIIEYLNKFEPIKITNYVDIGCGDGYLTSELGKVFGLAKKNIYGIDVGEFAGIKLNPSKEFNSATYNGTNIPFCSGGFDIATLFMVLHHVKEKDKKQLLDEIYRVIKNGGYLLMREHDRFNKLEPLIILEHYLYNIFVDKTYKKNGYTPKYDYYYSRQELIIYITSFGFTHIDVEHDFNHEKNPTNYHYVLFKKN